jgi:hypothetical protein
MRRANFAKDRKELTCEEVAEKSVNMLVQEVTGQILHIKVKD